MRTTIIAILTLIQSASAIPNEFYKHLHWIDINGLDLMPYNSINIQVHQSKDLEFSSVADFITKSQLLLGFSSTEGWRFDNYSETTLRVTIKINKK